MFYLLKIEMLANFNNIFLESKLEFKFSLCLSRFSSQKQNTKKDPITGVSYTIEDLFIFFRTLTVAAQVLVLFDLHP